MVYSLQHFKASKNIFRSHSYNHRQFIAYPDIYAELGSNFYFSFSVSVKIWLNQRVSIEELSLLEEYQYLLILTVLQKKVKQKILGLSRPDFLLQVADLEYISIKPDQMIKFILCRFICYLQRLLLEKHPNLQISLKAFKQHFLPEVSWKDMNTYFKYSKLKKKVVLKQMSNNCCIILFRNKNIRKIYSQFQVEVRDYHQKEIVKKFYYLIAHKTQNVQRFSQMEDYIKNFFQEMKGNSPLIPWTVQELEMAIKNMRVSFLELSSD